MVIDKSQPYEYNIAVYILQELCSEGIIDIFDLSEAHIKLRKLYNIPVIDIYGKKVIQVTKNNIDDKFLIS